MVVGVNAGAGPGDEVGVGEGAVREARLCGRGATGGGTDPLAVVVGEEPPVPLAVD